MTPWRHSWRPTLVAVGLGLGLRAGRGVCLAYQLARRALRGPDAPPPPWALRWLELDPAHLRPRRR